MAVLSAERHDLHRSSQEGMARCVAADTGAQETSLTFGGTSALLYHSTGHQMKTRILYESSHGRSCTFWLKCFWAVELLMCGTPGLHHIYFLVMMLGVAQKKVLDRLRERISWKVMFRMRSLAHVRSSENSAALLPWDITYHSAHDRYRTGHLTRTRAISRAG